MLLIWTSLKFCRLGKSSQLQKQILTLPNDKILRLSIFKAFADDKIFVTQKLKFTLGKIENIEGKGENAGYQRFPAMFSKVLFSRCVKSEDFVVKS